jgi:hypothetical protein
MIYDFRYTSSDEYLRQLAGYVVQGEGRSEQYDELFDELMEWLEVSGSDE